MPTYNERDYGTTTPQLRPYDSVGASRDTTESSEREPAGRTLWAQPQDGGQVEEANACH